MADNNGIFSAKAKAVLQAARMAARNLGSDCVSTEHLLLGLVREDSGFAVETLKALRINLVDLSEDIQRSLSSNGGLMTIGGNPRDGLLQFTGRAKAVLFNAAKIAKEEGDQYIGPEHLMLAILQQVDSSAVGILSSYNITYENFQQTLDQIKAEGGDGMIYKANVADLSQVKVMVREVFKAYGRIDVLVNNAGIVRDEYLLMMNPETLDKCFDLNVKGYFYCAQQVAVKMYKQKSGVIINMSSVSSKFALAGQAVYSATKGAVNSLTQTLAKELGGFGIRVNAVAPGFIATEMIEAIPEETRKGYVEKIPLKRFGTADEVANIVSALASDQFAYVTGQVFVLDGGLSL